MQWIRGIANIALFGVWPFLHFAAQNLTLHTDLGLSIPRLMAAAFGLIMLALTLWLALSLLFRRIHSDRWAAVTGIGIVVTFLFGPLASVMQDYGHFRHSQTVVWALAAAALLALVWLLSRSKDFSRKLTIIAVALNGLALMPLVFVQQEIGVELSPRKDEADVARAAPLVPSHSETKTRRPNVYFFIFDEYDRADQLKALFEFDNQSFLKGLTDRGFVIGEKSYANFPSTLLSVSSTLSMNLIVAEGKVFDWWGDGAREAKRVIDGYNPVVGRFRELGYKYIHGGGEAYVRCGNAEDLCIRAKPVTWITEQERLLMLMTPLRLFRYRFRFAADKFTPTVVKNAVRQLLGQPRFVYAHFMIPRSSVYQDGCATVTALDGMMHVKTLPRHDPALMRQRKLRYVNDIECVNPAVIDLVDSILADDADPIIIVQSDHGSTYLHDWSTAEWPDDEFKERYGILNAIRLPERCRQQLYPTMTPVNTFRIVFACIEERAPELVDDVSLLIRYYGKEPTRARRAGSKN